VPHLWRVPTDNDEGGGQSSFAHRWRQAGLDRLVVAAEEPKVETVSRDRVRVTVESRLSGAQAALSLKATYEIVSDGEVAVAGVFGAEGKLPPLPRVGFELQLPGGYDTAEWYGRGPHESYSDRKEGARFGVYRSKVSDLHFPHVMAQENGNHTDTRWLKLVDAQGSGLRVEPQGPLDFTAHDYTDAALLASKTRVHAQYQLLASTYRFAFRLRPAED
jgi:beta-galactosidase